MKKKQPIRRKKALVDPEHEREEAIKAFVETYAHVSGVDCRHCGVCCCPPLPDGQPNGYPYVELSHADLINLGSMAQSHLTPRPRRGKGPNYSGYYLNTYRDGDERGRCPFLEGHPGNNDQPCECGEYSHTNQPCECGIYIRRPRACRTYPKGSDECLKARASHPGINPHLRELLDKRAAKAVTVEVVKPTKKRRASKR